MPPEPHRGPKCRLAPPALEHRPAGLGPAAPCQQNAAGDSQPHDADADADDLESPPPPLLSQFFYASSIPIDDPLSPGTNPNTPDPAGFKGQLRPFSRPDSNVLEKAWRSLTAPCSRETHRHVYRLGNPSPQASQHHSELLARIIAKLAKAHFQKHGSRPEIYAAVLQPINSAAPVSECCSGLWADIDASLQHQFCALLRRHDFRFGPERVALEIMNELRRLILAKTTAHGPRNELGRSESSTSIPSTQEASRGSTPFAPESFKGTGVPRHLGEARVASRETMSDLETRTRALSSRLERDRPSTPVPSSFGSLPLLHTNAVKPAVTATTSSLPPVAPQVSVSVPTSGIGTLVQQARQRDELPFMPNQPRSGSQEGQSSSLSKRSARPAASNAPNSSSGRDAAAVDDTALPENTRPNSSSSTVPTLKTIDVPVGLSRLHVVSVAELVMRPIYWSPVNDLSSVMRATWFYEDTMLPVPVSVANQLEAGYRELRAWSETWKVQLECAVEIGAAGEEKISYPLWPQELSNPNAKMPCLNEPQITGDIYCAARCFYDEAAAEGDLQAPPEPTGQAPKQPPEATADTLHYPNHDVVYRDAQHAFLLKPSLKPSAYYGRRPISRIVKGVNVGVPVTRGFDRHVWEKLYEKSLNPPKAENWAASNVSGEDPGHASEAREDPGHVDQGQECPACVKQTEQVRVTDLVLVAHGIGQKFAERVESFHFTHAINSFRRAVNIELQNPVVKDLLRPDHNGIMILPLNWRHSLSFGDDGSAENEDCGAQDQSLAGNFGLKDIEPPTIPAVRSIISDVMFDIPFYMSHHKSKMISALVSEANRVYRLWCLNNPGFRETGRVHILGHSLGSAMALDILSRQPNHVPKPDLSPTKAPSLLHFEFNTCNLILCGSPSAFFLLLERGTLTPRKGRSKPGADPSDFNDPALTADAGQFGCLAVENVYNILAKEDPIAYLLTGTIDPAYAASLRPAYLPSTATSFLKSVGNAFKSWGPRGAPVANTDAPTATASPPDDHDVAPSAHLPSQLELEIHDFTREEVAEKKALLLNDNGQIDWYLRTTGGPLEIQYLNMLSAHTSYWKNHDFIRFLCVEIGRRPGRKHTVPDMRAKKVLKRSVEGVALGGL
ncbi:hypothetical protein BROUX41_006704 [Berkeleyomyces rouxiae]